MHSRFSTFFVCLTVVLATALGSFARAEEGSVRGGESSFSSKASPVLYTNAASNQEVRGKSLNSRESLTFAPSFEQSSAFSGDASSLRLDQQCDRFNAEAGQSSSFYLKIEGGNKEAYFLISVFHGIAKRDGKTPVAIEWLSAVKSNGERIAFDDGRGSATRRKDLERRGLVSKATRYVQLSGRPYLLEKEDVVVFKLEGPLSGGLVPLVPGSLGDVKVGDPITALTANGDEIGQTRSCHAADLNFINNEGYSRLRFLSTSANDKNALLSGDSGSAILDSDNKVVAVLLQIKNQGITRIDGDLQRLVSTDGLAVNIDALVAQIKSHWNL